MNPQSLVLGAAIATLMCGCIAPMDSVHLVKGVAPPTGACEVSVIAAGNPRPLVRESVKGKFTVAFTAAGPFPGQVDVTARCDDIVVKALRGVRPRSVEMIDLGDLVR